MNDETSPPEDKRPPKQTRLVIAVAVVAIAVVAVVVALLLWNRNRSGAGRPVPAPRTITSDSSGSPAQTGPTEPTITISAEAAQNARIKIETVGERPVDTETAGAPVTGTVEANTYRSTPVVSLVGGIVRRVNAELGQNVRQGQTLAVVFSNDLAKAQSEYLATVADLEEHHKHHSRTMKLVEIGAASREELEQATTKLRTAEAQVASQRQQLILLGLPAQRIAQLKSSAQVTSEVSLPAPVSGTVISRSVNPGEVITADKELLRVSDLSSVWVIAQVYEKDLGKIRIGSGASITSDAYPGRIFRGQVSYIDPAIDQTTRTAQVRVELANPGQVLKIGMFMNVAFATLAGSASTTAIVPKTAVQNINNQQVVFVATKEPNVFAMRPVRIGMESNGVFPVLEGLSIGEQIVTEGSFLLRAEWLKLHPAG
ncbi:MAG TPA: efflux RND transporter periplasmic adaptor subunit [Pyrinomonadaceae bacterium]|nr:efflux RND transporter periplasmic adaptor subunit [Pyrinomonadaceae bacterium]